MRSISVCVLFAAALNGQGSADLFRKAPPAVDKALRARIGQFYQLHVDGKYRQAEALVAADTRDYFYTANKPKYYSFEIKDITYSDDFTKAKALVVVSTVVMAPGFADKPVQVPTPSRWKLVDGQWYWYVDPDELNLTPFGKMKPGPGAMASQVPHIPSPEEAAKMINQVRADKNDAQLKGDVANSVKFVITNSLPGKISLALHAPHGTGFRARLDTTELPPAGKATVTVEWKPGDYRVPKFANLSVQVQPTNQLIPLHVTFTK